MANEFQEKEKKKKNILEFNPNFNCFVILFCGIIVQTDQNSSYRQTNNKIKIRIRICYFLNNDALKIINFELTVLTWQPFKAKQNFFHSKD